MTDLTPDQPEFDPTPISFQVIPASKNRQVAIHQPRQALRAQTDQDAAEVWLSLYADHSPNTIRNYSREVERLFLWLRWRGQSLRDFMLEDVQEYLRFIKDPEPRALWCVAVDPDHANSVRLPPRLGADGRRHPDWRPFVTGLSQSSAALARRCLHKFFEFLVVTQFLPANPLRALPNARKVKQQINTITRYLDPETWAHLWHFLDQLPQETPVQTAQAERARFLLSWYYLLGLRISEMSAARGFHLVRFEGGPCLRVVGKRQKERMLPLNDDALAALHRYRQSLGKPPSPNPDLDEPLVFDVYGKRSMGVKALHQVVTSLFAAAAVGAESQTRRVLEVASTHWIRHTAATEMANSMPLQTAQNALGHDSLATTSLYVHTSHKQLRTAMAEHTLPG